MIELIKKYMYFSGIESISIQIYPEKEGILGPSNLQLRCNYTLGSMETVFGINIQVKMNNVFTDIASFKATGANSTSLTNNGSYLSSRVTLSNLISSNAAILTFNQIECRDEKEYMCKVSIDADGSFNAVTSDATSIVVKGKYT